LNANYLYLVLDIGSLLVPFMYSFHPKAAFAKKWRFYLPGILVTASVFIMWDEYFTQKEIWGFNANYTTGIYLWSLPLEEILFFICIPYACCFTFFAVTHMFPKDHLKRGQRAFSSALILLCFIGGFVFWSKAYTSVTFLSLGLFLLIDVFVLRASYLGHFYVSYLLLLIPFSIVNGILTGSWTEDPVVWYNDHENLGVRIGTIPVEDIFYGILMLCLPISIAEKLERAQIKRALRRAL
jgi:lycopene cyclase domain-containing protein